MCLSSNFTSDSESINIELKNLWNKNRLLRFAFDGVDIINDFENNRFPMPSDMER